MDGSKNLTKQDMLKFIDVVVRDGTLIGHHISEYDSLVTSGLDHIFKDVFNKERQFKNVQKKNTNILYFVVKTTFSNVQIKRPTDLQLQQYNEHKLYPKAALQKGHFYSSPIYLDTNISIKAYNMSNIPVGERQETVSSYSIGNFPVMVGSCLCNTTGLPKSTLYKLGESVVEDGGYFIFKRNEYVFWLSENIRYNEPRFSKFIKNKIELVRMEIVSQKKGNQFENSQQNIIELKGGAVYFKFATSRGRVDDNSKSEVTVPFYVIYNMFGMVDEDDIVSTIVGRLANDEVSNTIRNDILRSLESDPSKTQPQDQFLFDIFQRLLSPSVFKTYEGMENTTGRLFLKKHYLRFLDYTMFPHIGISDSDRYFKLHYIGQLINNIFLVKYGLKESIDRDSLVHKRVMGSGSEIAKKLKSRFNAIIKKKLDEKINRLLTDKSFHEITEGDLSSIVTQEYQNAQSVFTKSIQAVLLPVSEKKSSSDASRQTRSSKIHANLLERKNTLNSISSLRTITTHNSKNVTKQTERAEHMRRVHSTFPGYICIVQSSDSGEAIGMQKQLAITASITGFVNEGHIKDLLEREAGENYYKLTTNNLHTTDHSKVLVNGSHVGYAKSPYALVQKYRTYRRSTNKIDNNVSICWNSKSSEVEFLTDNGRLRRPLIIVYNNIEEYDNWCMNKKDGPSSTPPLPFRQWITYTANVNTTMSEMLETGVCEYITPEESLNCYVCPDIETFYANSGNVLKQYTHVEVEQAVFGLAGMVSPFSNNTQPARVTMCTNHARQTGGYFVDNFFSKFDKTRFLQFQCEYPITTTYSYRHIFPNGSNMMTALMSYSGDNQEDSSIVNGASVSRGMLDGVRYKVFLEVIDRHEFVQIPNKNTVKRYKNNSNYSKLGSNGIIQENQFIENGDIIIGKVKRGDTGDDMIDHSVKYYQEDKLLVEKVLQDYDSDGNLFIAIRTCSYRPFGIGEKCSSRSGNKNIVGRVMRLSELPFDRDGVVPDIIMNPHSIPSRMPIGQLIEMAASEDAVQGCYSIDGTPFLNAIDLQRIKNSSMRRLWSGITNDVIDNPIFMGYMYGQRLQKFVFDDNQVSGGKGIIDNKTGEPSKRKEVGHTALKLGEMERWEMAALGIINNMFEKKNTDSNGVPAAVCRSCGAFGICNERINLYECVNCKNLAELQLVETTKSSLLFIDNLAGANIDVRIGLEPRKLLAPDDDTTK